MPRLFVALDPSDAVRDALVGVRTEMAGARWLEAAQLHLTLAFLGDVDDALAEAVERALAGVEAEPVPLALTALGAFPNRRSPRVLVAGVTASPALLDLQRRVVDALLRAGVTLASRPFRPHLTLARLKHSDPRAVGDFLARPLPAQAFEAEAFHLYRSELTPRGARYHRLRTFALRRR